MNNINLGDNIAPTLSAEEMVARSKTMTEEEIHDMELKNVNNILFDSAELDDRNQRRFSSVHAEYQNMKNLLKTIEKMKREKPLYDDLPIKLREFFIEEARQ
jgi:transcriptional regulator NrdR family protein